MKMVFQIHDYKVIDTGVDGGHRYIETHIDYNNKTRRLTIFFESKLAENKLIADRAIKVEGLIQDDGKDFGLLLIKSKLIG